MFLLAAATALAQSRQPNYNFFDSRELQAPRSALVEAAALAPAANADAETVARGYLQQWQESLGLESTTVFSLPLEFRYETEAAGLTHLVFGRRHAGIPLFGGEVLVHTTREGAVLRVDSGSPWPAGAAPAQSPALGADQAVAAALAALAPGILPAAVEPARPRLVWFLQRDGPVLAWELYLHLDASRWYCVVVDAVTAELLFSHNLYRDNQPRGRVFRAGEIAHPNAGAPTVENFTGWPASAGDCPAAIYPAQYRSGGLLQRCWVDSTETAGNNAVACLDADGNNVCDWKAADPQAHFEFPFLNSYAASGDAISDRNAAVTNLFYWVNALHDWLYGLGFTEAAGNFQTDNFGRGGFGGDAVLADAQDGAALNNASFATPPDGSAPRLQVHLFTNNGTFLRRDGAFDGDVITHEYVHGLTLRLIGGPGATNDLWLWQSGAMGEGWSDAYAASFTNDPVVGDYVSATPATGIRSVAYNNSPHTFGRFGALYRRSIGALGLLIDLPQVHRDGEIWATVLWDLRAALGKSVFEQLVTAALKLTPTRPSMLDARGAILQAAQAMAVSPCAVWAVFAARGFGASAALNHVQAGQAPDTALSVYEAFDSPASCGGSPPAPGTTIFSDDAESGPAGWTATGQWHITSRRAAGGSRSWWFGQEATGNYSAGVRASGTLTSSPISLASASKAILEWDQFFKGEGFNRAYPLGPTGSDPYLNYDTGWVLISRDGGSTWDTLTTLAHNTDATAFDPHKIDISRYAGSTILVRFLFDTLDEQYNTNEGWFIDNIRVRRLLTGTPALSVTPASLDFAAAGSQSLSVANLDGGTMNWTAAASSSGWLSVLPVSGTGNATLTVTVSAGLAPGTYNGSITVTAPGATGSPAVVSVTLTLVAAVAEWRMEEAAAGPGVTLSDSSGSGRHGVTFGYGSAAFTGATGYGRAFNGVTDRVEAPASAAFSPTSFTFRAWVKLAAYPAADGWAVVAANYGGNYQGWYVGVTAAGRVVFSVASLPSSAPWLVSGAALALGRWYCITTTYDGVTREGAIYINGALDVQAAFAGFSPQSALPFTLGRASWFSGYHLNAVLDEGRLLPIRQTPAGVLADYQAFPAPPPPPSSTSVVADWLMDDTGSTLADSSGNARHGSFAGGASSAGVRNTARVFNGIGDSAQVSASDAFSPASLTVRVWVKLLAYPEAAGWGVVASNYSGNYQGWYLGVHSSGRLIFSVASLPSSSPWLLSNTVLALQRWYCVTAIYDAPSRLATLYVDGLANAQATLAGFTPSPASILFFARSSWYDGYYLNAATDEARIEPVARSAAGVLADYLSFPTPTPPSSPQAIAEWRLDDLSGNTLADSSGNGRHAAAQGTAATTGKRNSARSFNGFSDSAQAPASAAFSPASFTLRAWVKLATLPAAWGVIAANYDGNYQGWYLGVHSSGRVIFSVASLPASSPWLLSSAVLGLNTWQHVTVTWDGATRTAAIYVNGAADTQAVLPGFSPQSTYDFSLGRASWYNGYHLNAILDEVRLLAFRQAPPEILLDFQSF